MAVEEFFYERHYFPGSGKRAVLRTRRPMCMLSAILTLVVIGLGVAALVAAFNAGRIWSSFMR